VSALRHFAIGSAAAGALAFAAVRIGWPGAPDGAPLPAVHTAMPQPAAAAAAPTARSAAEALAQRHGLRLVFGPGVRADQAATADALRDTTAPPEATLRRLLGGYELLFHYAPARDGPRLETVWVFDDPADVPRQIAAARAVADEPEALPRDADAAALRHIVDDGDSEAVRIAALEAWLQDPHTPAAEAERLLAQLADSPHPLLAEQARALREARLAAPPADAPTADDAAR
jgi:hypothetical protein